MWFNIDMQIKSDYNKLRWSHKDNFSKIKLMTKRDTGTHLLCRQKCQLRDTMCLPGFINLDSGV